MKYEFIFCFLKKDGSVETDEYDCEMYHRESVEAISATDALRKFYRKFENKPEIVEIIKGE